MDIPTSPTMTLHELCEAFRANLVSTSEETEARYITEGKYPFAEGVRPDKSTIHNNLKIWREPFYTWLQQRIATPVIRVKPER